MTDPLMKEIERKARVYADARAALAGEVRATEAEMAAVKDLHLAALKSRLNRAAAAKAALVATVESAQPLFRKPKTRILHGIKVGWVKAKGKVTFADAASVVKLIRRHLPDRFDELVKVTETPLKGALSRLTGVELKRIGVALGDDADEPVVAPADSEIDKLVDALLDEGEPSGAELEEVR